MTTELVDELLAAGATWTVGTVDKFQGQEASIVIYAMAASRPEDAPGMEFLYAADRLNVATSRARCVALIIANPALMEPGCRTVRQMELANGYCRVGEVATRCAGSSPSEVVGV